MINQILQVIQIKRDPKGIETRIRATLKKEKFTQNSGTDVQKKIRQLIEENTRYKHILEIVS